VGKDCGGNPDYSPLQSIPAFWNRLFTHHSGAKYRIISTIVPTISATLHLNHFLFLLPNIKITVINISQIFALENVTTADLFFCYKLVAKTHGLARGMKATYFSLEFHIEQMYNVCINQKEVK